jgi:hypothetical protein
MITPNQKYLDRTLKIPTITIAGQEWPIPKFAPKQNEVIVPIVLEMSSELIKAMSSPQAVRLTMLAHVLTGDNYRKLNDCIYLAIQRGHPDLTRKEYDEEWEVGTMEMVHAFTTIAERTGLIKVVPTAGVGAAKPGEEQADHSQTGQKSLPE